MIRQVALGATSYTQLRALVKLVQAGHITLGGNGPGCIYGRLNCRAGKRMKAANRVFFRDGAQAHEQGFRPCAVCMPDAYRAWRTSR
jgi:hypothetical protein